MANFTQVGAEIVERSYCCFAPVSQALVRPGSMYDPPEYGEFCTSCGRPCDSGKFIRNDEDGVLTDMETGEKHPEGKDRELDLGGPDPDAEMELRRELERDGD